MAENTVNIGSAPQIQEQKSPIPQMRSLATEIWRIFAEIIRWVKGNYCTEKDVEAIVERMLKGRVILIKQMKAPEHVPEGFVAIYADVDDGNEPKLKYNTGSGEGVVRRVIHQENEASEEG